MGGLDKENTARRRAPWKGPLLAVLGLVLLGWSDEVTSDRSVAARDAELLRAETRGPTRPPIHGTDFPDGVLALTWDDGPDVMTLELARWLRRERVAGTFFVVGDWVDGISEEPGVGAKVHSTGYRHIPILADLVALGHRIGSHTENHALLGGASAVSVGEQLGQCQHELDPFLGNELRMFRAPGGSWSRSAAAAIADPFLSDVVGPFHWDIDGKDWESSLYCRGSESECEPGPIPGRTRVRPGVVARRYVARAESMRRGIVLMHDRVGDVGSHYAFDVARSLIPELSARGFVFAAPLLAFGPLTGRLPLANVNADDASMRFADVDGDGRDDLCRQESGAVVCSYGTAVYADPHAIAQAAFTAPRPALRLPSGTRSFDVADIDGDGRADICVMTDGAIDCALAGDDRTFAPLRRWSTALTSLQSAAYARSFRLADIDGDGAADACVRSGEGILCATSTNSSFSHPRAWLGSAAPYDGTQLELGDLDGDGRADVCGPTRTADGIACALSNGHGFGNATVWSVAGDLDRSHKVRLADLNGDGRADLCATGAGGVVCALSNGRGFKHSSIWAKAHPTDDVRFADLNGDGRSDLCVLHRDRLDCGLAP